MLLLSCLVGGEILCLLSVGVVDQFLSKQNYRPASNKACFVQIVVELIIERFGIQSKPVLSSSPQSSICARYTIHILMQYIRRRLLEPAVQA